MMGHLQILEMPVIWDRIDDSDHILHAGYDHWISPSPCALYSGIKRVRLVLNSERKCHRNGRSRAAQYSGGMIRT